MPIQGIYFDFGFVIGYPTPGLERKFLYLDWNGIDTIIEDQEISPYLRPGIRRESLEVFFTQEIYDVFVRHEQTDSIDPQSNKLLLTKLPLVFDHPIDQGFVDKILAHIDTMKYIILDPKALEVVGELKNRGYQLSLISNMMLPGKLLVGKLQREGVLDYFDTISISSDVGFIKPHPEIFRQTLAQDNLNADNVVFIGDTYQQDIIGAKRVGMKTIWLNSRNEPRDLVTEDSPDYEIQSLEALIQNQIFDL
jgi:FMN phosphatase YigB (HAD superfamily)